MLVAAVFGIPSLTLAGGSYGSSGGSYGSSGGYYHSASTGHTSSSYYAATTSKSATLVVKVPENARVYLQDQKMTLTGTTRRFYSPALDSSKSYVYTVRVEVDRDGRTITRETEATVTAGGNVEVSVDFAGPDAAELVADVRTPAAR
ncbi:MAG: TIGR03000 domain-containing protein [Planctomycetaceae bacterium]|nr:TIGR03000 domain-containing protein [Planctomycetaceae bacterium]